MKFLKLSVVLFAAFMAVTGCSSKGGLKGDGSADGQAAGLGGPEIGKYGEGSGDMYGSGSGAGGSGGRYGSGSGSMSGDAALDDPSSPLSKRVIYFMYDSSDVSPEYVQVLNAHASYLAANPSKTAVLEGHADERGSPEYNIALGEQRAKSVAAKMKLQGVSDRQLQIVSFGEEKPAVSGHDESAYQQNRRVEIAYPGH